MDEIVKISRYLSLLQFSQFIDTVFYMSDKNTSSDSLIHNPDEEIEYTTKTVYSTKTNHPVRQFTYCNGALQSAPDGSPSLVHFDAQGRVERIAWHENNKQHRSMGPSAVSYDPETGAIVGETFLRHGQYRDPSEGPYLIIRNTDGDIVSESYAPHSEPNLDHKQKPSDYEGCHLEP